MDVVVASLEPPGCHVLTTPVSADVRGSFYKPYQRSALRRLGLPTDYDEQFFSRSARGVVRGLHLQVPPADQWKLVACLTGAVHDVLLDLRTQSPAFGRVVALHLSADSGNAVLIAPGVAHGFQALEDDTVMAYWVSAEYDPAADTGVRWDSAGIAWPAPALAVSERDASLPPLQQFASPFTGPVPT